MIPQKTLHIIGLTSIIIAFAHIGQLLMNGIKYILESEQQLYTPPFVLEALLIILLVAIIFLVYRVIKIYFSLKGGSRAEKVLLMTGIIVSFSLVGQLLIQIRSFSLDYENISPGLTDIIIRIILGILFLSVLILGYKTLKMYVDVSQEKRRSI